jgi:hypothetical protein
MTTREIKKPPMGGLFKAKSAQGLLVVVLQKLFLASKTLKLKATFLIFFGLLRGF